MEMKQKVIYVKDDDCKFIKDYNTWELFRSGRSFEIDPFSEISDLLDSYIRDIGNEWTIDLKDEKNHIILKWMEE